MPGNLAVRDWQGWLLDSDPALRWQVERDIAGEPEHVWSATRAQIATHGFGRRLLDRQDSDGQWAGGAFFPGRDLAPTSEDEGGQPWTATTPTLTMLREWGLDARALDGTAERLAANSRWEYDDLPYWGGEVDCCINAVTLANGAWLGADVSQLDAWFPRHQMEDGGWNCEWVQGSTRSSFHSTLNSLKGLLAYEELTGDASARPNRHRAEEYLLSRRLLYALSSGEQVGPWAMQFAYPFRWVYTALNALDYFRCAAGHDRTAPDPRLADAVAVVRAARREDGTWLQGTRYDGRVWIEVDAPVAEPSKWLTLYAARVLRWWDTARPPPD